MSLQNWFLDASILFIRLKILIDKQFDLEDQLQQRENEISQLQDSLSDVQLMLFEEREHGLKLQAENDKFQVRKYVHFQYFKLYSLL